MVNVQALKVPTIRDEVWTSVFGNNPHPFQSRVVNTIEKMRNDKGGVILFELPTGLGKTRGLISHALLKQESAILVYPNNALRADQARQIRVDVARNGNSHYVRDIDAYHLRAYMQESETREYARKGRALWELLSTGLGPFQKKVIALTNPDIFTLLMHGRPAMHQMTLQQICRAYPVIGFDEVHTYDIKQLSSLIHAARVLVETIPFVFIFSSATISSTLYRMLETFPAFEIEDLDKQLVVKSEDVAAERLILSSMELYIEGVADWRGGDWARKEENALRIKQLASNGGCVLIFDSVPESMSVYTALAETEGVNNVGLVIGAVEQTDRKREMMKNIVVGNNAIRVGIDFSRENAKRNAVVYARSMFDAVQGLGRIGRGEEETAKAYLLAYPYSVEMMNLEYPPEGITRRELTQLLAGAFPGFETFKAYLSKWAHIEAMHMQNATGLWHPRIIQQLFGIGDSRVDYGDLKKYNRDMLNDLTLFRHAEPFNVAVIDEMFREKGLFEFNTADVYRVFRWGDIEPIGWNEYEREVRQRTGSTERAEVFIYNLREGRERGDVVGCCRVRKWESKARKVYFTNDGIADPRQNQESLKNGTGWELLRKSQLPKHIQTIYDQVCERMREQPLTYIIFSPDAHKLPPLFKSYPIFKEGSGSSLAVAFGHNAFLIDSIVSGDPVYIV